MGTDEAERLEVIRKLLAKAESTTHVEEAEAFFAKAQELMTRWAIDDAMLKGASAEDIGTIAAEYLNIDANEYRGPKIQLLNVVARANDVRLVLIGKQRYIADPSRPQGRRRVQVVEMVGYERDRRFTELIWTSLLAQAEREFQLPDQQAAMRERMDWEQPNKRGGFRIRWHNTFMNGYVEGVRSNLDKARKHTVEAGEPGTSIVLASRADQVDAEFDRLHPKVGISRSSAGHGSSEAYAGGQRAGARADVGRPRVGGSRPALGG